MKRDFHSTDNGKRFHYNGHYGKLEFPLTDPGSAEPGEGILWFGDTWEYVKPQDVDPDGWVAEGTVSERHTPNQPTLTPFHKK